ncbi:NACHT domain-containing NTPase [Gloeocapsa sp. PCC 73106]|uniref:NACHT domain-containing protein n=1 Tax=Gloeocapsa sp. PCC 73106 TaxID=102232 RepID=UPI0002ABA73C|nr:NACHT domain-containing protein [Gloeocapsa sp. PCC 73106]ELR96753.1 putative NTPase (NACHT family) [Gloeocapsa sp. PCC 73106]
MLWKTNSRFQELYYKTLSAAYRTYPVQSLKHSGRISFELDRVYVLPHLVSKPLEQVSTGLVNLERSELPSLCIWDFLAKLNQEPAYRKILLLGGPGTGKTLLLEYLTLVYAQGNQRQAQEKVPKLIPILLYLRQIRKLILNNEQITLAEVTSIILKREFSLKLDASTNWFEQKLNLGKCLVMLDGLDEVRDPRERRIVRDWLDEQLELYPKNCHIISARPCGYLDYPLKTTTISLELQGYNSQQIEKFLQNFYFEEHLLQQAHQNDNLLKQKARKRALQLNNLIKNVPTLTFLASSPLLLTFITAFAQNSDSILKKRLELYGGICELLLTTRPKAKGIPTLYNLDSTQVQLILQKLALELMRREQTQFTLAEGLEIISQPFSNLVVAPQAPAQFLQYIEDITGLLQRVSTKLYQFIHLSFQEYLAAAEIKHTNQEQILIDKIDHPWWSETIRLYSACSDTSQIVIAAWNRRSVITMSLAYDCWQEGQTVNPQLKQRLENWLDAALESSDPEIANLAAKVHLSRRLQYYAVASD